MAKLVEMEGVEALEIEIGMITQETIDNLMRRDATLYEQIIRKNEEIKRLKLKIQRLREALERAYTPRGR